MSTDARIRAEIQRREDLRRLADQAERRGVRIFHTRDGRHFATSATDPTLLYPVGVELGCSCLSAVHGGLCGHLGLLLDELGLLGDPDGEWPPVCPLPTDPYAAHVAWLDEDAPRETVTRSRWVGGARDGFRVEHTVAA